jgi:hypothetical protein
LQSNIAFGCEPQQPIAAVAVGYDLFNCFIASPINGGLAGINGMEVLFEGFHWLGIKVELSS